MGVDRVTGLMAARRQAEKLLSASDFTGVVAVLHAALDEHEDAVALTLLGTACRALGDVRSAVDAFERAYRRFLADDNHPDAGVAACTLADLELTNSGASAVASGWLSRGRSHLNFEPEHPGHAYLEGLCAYQAMAYEKDPLAARSFATAAVAHGQRLGDRAAELMGKAYLGYIDVALGRLEEGFRLLDESTAAALGGEIPTVEALDTYCVLITACERVRDFDRVDQWARRVLLLSEQVGSDSFAPFGRTAWANALTWRGHWEAAETELARVLENADGKPLTAAMAMVARSALRRRQGRLDEADEELSRTEREPYRRAVRHLVLAARARLELDRGDPQRAADVAERYLKAVSESDLIERVDALETLVRARIELGEVAAAAAAATELEHLAEQIPTPGVRAAATAGRARVDRARGHLDQARDSFDQAVALFDEAGLRHDAVETQLGLAMVLLEAGDPDAARRVAEPAAAAARDLGATREITAADRLLSRVRGRPGDGGDLTQREIEVLRLAADGLANGDIAQRLFLSVRTVERHLSNAYLKIGATGPSARMVAVAHARKAGLLE
jgi:ATP/maltotriose-dependent transcriptional regulator MalT